MKNTSPFNERIAFGDGEVNVAFWFYPASRGLRERSGLQLEPDEPASIEIAAIKDLQGNEIFGTADMSAREEQEIKRQLFALRAECEYEERYCDND